MSWRKIVRVFGLVGQPPAPCFWIQDPTAARATFTLLQVSADSRRLHAVIALSAFRLELETLRFDFEVVPLEPLGAWPGLRRCRAGTYGYLVDVGWHVAGDPPPVWRRRLLAECPALRLQEARLLGVDDWRDFSLLYLELGESPRAFGGGLPLIEAQVTAETAGRCL